MSDSKIDLSAIERAPIKVDEELDGVPEALAKAYEDLGVLADLLTEAEAEIEKLNAKATVDDIKAQMLQPYAEKVYGFVAIYCTGVFILLLASGQRNGDFHLSDTVLSIISGSTAVSVIGLIGMVISGLFGVGKK
ncbi:hypothetical protein [Novosphingobium sp. 17-62-19]|uniref:PspA/IM30 family protein n=1 Tax=Novosphingobium sp. 17-62-19 TaxID=1970406 RepID=UPI0025D79502|nr:hypothetical protein [Novosphingobium sp. 17-62-19]